MATLKLGGLHYLVPALKLGRLIEAAPLIEAINAAFLEGEAKLTGSLTLTRHILEIAVIGLRGQPGAPSLEALLEQAGLEDAEGIRDFFFGLMRDCGFVPAGEARAADSGATPPQPAPAQASASN